MLAAAAAAAAAVNGGGSVPSSTPGLGYWPSGLSTAAMGLAAHDLLPAAAMLQHLMPNTAWAELGAQTAACFHAGLSPALYWQYVTAAALLAQPPNSAAMVNAARAYHHFQQALNPGLVSDWLDERTPSLASSAASEESAKESPNVERGDRVSEAVEPGMEEEDGQQQQQQHVTQQPTAAAAAAALKKGAAATAGGEGSDQAAAAGSQQQAALTPGHHRANKGAAGVLGAAAVAAAAAAGGRLAGRKRHAAETDTTVSWRDLFRGIRLYT
ncbi:hypothetical protein OEZ85_002445 [Tetradesmus obliquus]|uniref:Uncharacterized protein n=1 Tax=Tetradesmus obliquus TaxID=3088 RepID=A0ABY8TXI8_TETOB|nr:hypothetical protein OEZ85_002445 [Tetradesmus obliquus]